MHAVCLLLVCLFLLPSALGWEQCVDTKKGGIICITIHVRDTWLFIALGPTMRAQWNLADLLNTPTLQLCYPLPFKNEACLEMRQFRVQLKPKTEVNGCLYLTGTAFGYALYEQSVGCVRL